MTKKDDEAGDGVKERPAMRPRLGFLGGQFKVPDDFNTMGAAEIEAMFYGEGDEASESDGREGK
jgi:hypothetical protein